MLLINSKRRERIEYLIIWLNPKSNGYRLISNQSLGELTAHMRALWLPGYRIVKYYSVVMLSYNAIQVIVTGAETEI